MTKARKAVALILVGITVFAFSGCLRYTSNILEVTTRPNNPGNIGQAEQTTTIYITNNQPSVETTRPPEVQTTLPQITEITTAPQTETTTSAPVVQPEETTQPAEKDPSSWTTAEILKFTTDAVTKTKAYTSQITVNHKEAFTANVTKAPGGSMIKNIANGIIEGFIKPTDTVLTFKGGKTTTDEGELPLLLPKRGAFTLTIDGIANATAKKNGSNVVVKITLVEELGTLTSVPSHHASSVGYLDIADVDLMGVKLNYLNITYTGTTAEFVINPDGYVVSADYKIPVQIACEGSAMGLNAQIECVGEQSENWKINW